jgi:Ala-tRNA(Pro) deacylase
MKSEIEKNDNLDEISKPVYESICNYLNEKSIQFRSIHHTQTSTSEELANERGEEISIAGKALFIKLDESFKIFALSVSKKLDAKLIKQRLNAKKLRFASVDELKALTGLVPGSVPPFGRPILPFDLYVDDSIINNEKIAFSAGSLTDSIVMNVQDYLKVTSPVCFKFSI